MVTVFRRSLSFPNKISPHRQSKPSISHHVRSISLPSRSHPLTSQLKDQTTSLTTWSSTPDHSKTSAWLCDGLRILKSIHDNLDDILQLPQSQESLRRSQSQWVEKVLEDFIRFVDVYGIFQASVLSLKEEHSAAQVALRKKDELKLSLYVKARKRMAKEMRNLVSTVRCIRVLNKRSDPSDTSVLDGGDELSGVIEDVIEATVTVSLALFSGMAESLGKRKTTSWMGLIRMSKKAKRVKGRHEDGIIEEFKEEGKMGMKKMEEVEGCIKGIESGSERVFRSLIQARVSLLNALTM